MRQEFSEYSIASLYLVASTMMCLALPLCVEGNGPRSKYTAYIHRAQCDPVFLFVVARFEPVAFIRMKLQQSRIVLF